MNGSNGTFAGPDGGFRVMATPMERQHPDVLHPFAWDELMGRRAGTAGFQAAAHIWRHPGALVLGLRDRRLPRAEEAIARIRQSGVSVAVRNSGGAAVPLDAGVVNISLVVPREYGLGMDFREDFLRMADLISDTVREWSDGTETGEIRGSYCPGDYDLSIGGRKFCGIAQRRQLKGCVISAFIVVEGEGAERGRRAAEFYRMATGGLPHPDDPGVQPGAMASLEELAGIRSADDFARALSERLVRLGGRLADPEELRLPEAEVLDAVEELRRRYDPEDG